jgi:hypothetical protein
MSNTQVTSEHEVETFLRVKRRLDKLEEGIPVKMTGHLNKELERLASLAVMEFPVYNDAGERAFKISIDGQAAGTMENPDVDSILRKSTTSAFGKGEETVIDETYRRGMEIPGANISIENHERLVQDIRACVSQFMFTSRTITIKLYKLAVYTDGGHFDWHRDTTHSDQHHATVLVALNTTWLGGDLVLRRNGAESRPDMKPKLFQDVERGLSIHDLQAVAFYTDTEHKVEPVSEGVRIVLQYDVEVKSLPKGFTDRTGEAGDMNCDDTDAEIDWDYGAVLQGVQSAFSGRQRQPLHGGLIAADSDVIKIIIGIIKSTLESGVEQVGVALLHLYRKSAILPEFLKGSDTRLYDALVRESFDVSLDPIVLRESSKYDGSFGSIYAYRFNHTVPETKAVDDASDYWDGDSEVMTADRASDGKATIFYVPRSSAIQQISSQEYIEHTGNEAQPAEYKYFGGGIFVRLKKSD